MPLWGNVDNAANSTIYAAAQVKLTPDAANQTSLFDNTTADAFITNATIGQFGVDTKEQRAKSGNTAIGAHAGWNLRTVGSGGRAGRVFYETLVAMGSMSGDASDDTVLPDYRIVITTQPQSSSLGTGNAINFTVAATSIPSGATLTYKWQRTYGAVAWEDVANTGVFQSANGNTTTTLSVSNNATLSGNTLRVMISATGAATAYSTNAVITVI